MTEQSLVESVEFGKRTVRRTGRVGIKWAHCPVAQSASVGGSPQSSVSLVSPSSFAHPSVGPVAGRLVKARCVTGLKKSMSTRFDRGLFKQLPIVGILRFFKRAEIEKLVPATLQGGLCNLEITMNSEGAEDSIRLTCALAAGRANVGAGTVTSVEAMERALAAGASFIVTPVVIPEVIQA